jgi:cob(I)alamin adenosyltransferase
MEKMIDVWSRKLPELKNFILPGGSLANAHLHLARAVCRRAERALIILGKQKKVRPELYVYLNRLSDFLFVGARWVNY